MTFIRKCSVKVRGFTLLETMVAVTLLSVAIVAPMSLTTQSLAAAYYARDEITAFYLAQEGLEAVRNVRDNNILIVSQGGSAAAALTDGILNGIPINATFRIDTTNNAMTRCSSDGGTCIALKTDSNINPSIGLYGYTSGWAISQFTRTLIACFVQTNGACNSTVSDEVKVTATVVWKTGSIQQRSVTISENLYRWVQDSSASG